MRFGACDRVSQTTVGELTLSVWCTLVRLLHDNCLCGVGHYKTNAARIPWVHAQTSQLKACCVMSMVHMVWTCWALYESTKSQRDHHSSPGYAECQGIPANGQGRRGRRPFLSSIDWWINKVIPPPSSTRQHFHRQHPHCGKTSQGVSGVSVIECVGNWYWCCDSKDAYTCVGTSPHGCSSELSDTNEQW